MDIHTGICARMVTVTATRMAFDPSITTTERGLWAVKWSYAGRLADLLGSGRTHAADGAGTEGLAWHGDQVLTAGGAAGGFVAFGRQADALDQAGRLDTLGSVGSLALHGSQLYFDRRRR